MGLLRKLANKLPDLFPQKVEFKVGNETPVEIQRMEQIKLQDTQPLEKPVVMGPRFPSKTAERRMVELACNLRRGTGKRGTLVMHFRDGTHIDVTISKPYYIREYNGGCIVKVDAT